MLDISISLLMLPRNFSSLFAFNIANNSKRLFKSEDVLHKSDACYPDSDSFSVYSFSVWTTQEFSSFKSNKTSFDIK